MTTEHVYVELMIEVRTSGGESSLVLIVVNFLSLVRKRNVSNHDLSYLCMNIILR